MTKPAIIRYPRFSLETAREKYFQSILHLFLPYRKDVQLKPRQFPTYEIFYETGSVRYSGDKNILSVKEIVDSNMSRYVKDTENLEDAERVFDARGPQEDAWCELCPETELDRQECIEEGKLTTAVEEENSDQLIPDLNRNNNSKSSTANLLLSTFSKNDIVPLLQTLNVKQNEVFFKVRDWCIKKKNGQHPDPFSCFITGGAGTGKSHLIKCIFYEATLLLAHISENPDDQTVLLTAPTGTAAFNIKGLTIHSALGIFKSLSLDHALLSEDKLNSLRSKLENLQIMIIDEISMVNKRLFFIHERLRQIKKMPESCPFGGVSIIAVGDFYQLPPVRTKTIDKLYVNDPSNPMNQLWNDLFSIVELDEIMRQREDRYFAELLNRLRVKNKNEKLSEIDKITLQQRIQEGHVDVLHICSTNEEIKVFNNEMILKVCGEPKLIEAEDYVKDKTSGKLTRRTSHFTKTDVCLPSSILLAEGARIMLIRNEDTLDGLVVNGVMGTVMCISFESISSLPDIIFIHFDNERIGINAQIQRFINEKRCVGLRPSCEQVPVKNGVRKQYPLQLAWACTIHKVQGMTVKDCVVDLNKWFAYGQAYVALSRATSIDGLYLKNIDIKKLEKKIYCDPDIIKGISSMTKYIKDQNQDEPCENSTVVMYHNIQGLHQHKLDLENNKHFLNADFICLTETWCNVNSVFTEIKHFAGRHRLRSLSYDDNSSLHRELVQLQHGGVGVYHKLGIPF